MNTKLESLGELLGDPRAKPNPPCAACGKPSRAKAALYWGKHLCEACEDSWADSVDLLARVPDDMGPVFEGWMTQRKAKGRVAA